MLANQISLACACAYWYIKKNIKKKRGGGSEDNYSAHIDRTLGFTFMHCIVDGNQTFLGGDHKKKSDGRISGKKAAKLELGNGTSQWLCSLCHCTKSKNERVITPLHPSTPLLSLM